MTTTDLKVFLDCLSVRRGEVNMTILAEAGKADNILKLTLSKEQESLSQLLTADIFDLYADHATERWMLFFHELLIY